MKRGLLFLTTLLSLILFSATITHAQVRPNQNDTTIGEDQAVVISALRSALEIIQDITRRHATTPIAEQLQVISGRMGNAADGYGGFRDTSESLTTQDLSELLTEIRHDLRSILRELEAIGEDELAEDLSDRIAQMRRAVHIADELEREVTPTEDDRFADNRQSRRVYSDEKERSSRIRINSSDDDRRERKNHHDEPFWRRSNIDWHKQSSSFVGEYSRRWPYKDLALYRPIPAVRYNRVEGLVLGIRRLPLDWGDSDRGTIYGQAGYAFSLEDWRYEIGAETKLGNSYRYSDFDLKFGGAYRQNTATGDLWKSSWAENSLAASLFRYDFFDYYETEGWTAYVIGKITPYFQFSVGFREDEYRTLRNETTWSLFGGDPFRFNPSIQEGEMRSVVASMEGGRVRGYNYLPMGVAFRFEAEFGKGMGGDFSFNRYLGDLRSYARLSRDTGFSLRLRAGYAEGAVPSQKAFTLGGVGSVRAYSQNAVFGTRMLLANAEYTMYRPGFFDDIFDDIAFFGLFDAGWTNTAGVNEFQMDDVFTAAGFGVSLDDRNIRIEVAWPLRDLGAGRDPAVWLRLSPTF